MAANYRRHFYKLGNNMDNNVAGDRSVSRNFVARYAAEAVLRTEGVAGLEAGSLSLIKEQFGGKSDGKGVTVKYGDTQNSTVIINIYPIVYFGFDVPEVAYKIQENVKKDIEKYTDLEVLSVDIHVKGICELGEI